MAQHLVGKISSSNKSGSWILLFLVEVDFVISIWFVWIHRLINIFILPSLDVSLPIFVFFFDVLEYVLIRLFLLLTLSFLLFFFLLSCLFPLSSFLLFFVPIFLDNLIFVLIRLFLFILLFSFILHYLFLNIKLIKFFNCSSIFWYTFVLNSGFIPLLTPN